MFCMFSICNKPPVALHTPSTPHEPAGPSTGRADTAYTFQTYSTDPDSDNIRYRIFVSGGDTSDWSSWNGSGDTFTFTVTFPGPDTLAITAQAKDPDDSVSAWSDPHVIVISQSPNHAPTSDSFIVVSAQLTTLSYSSWAYPSDPDGNAVACRWDWGDGDTSAWTDFGRGPKYHLWSPPHQYVTAGSYAVRVQAKDTWGLQSAWSQPKTWSLATRTSRGKRIADSTSQSRQCRLLCTRQATVTS